MSRFVTARVKLMTCYLLPQLAVRVFTARCWA